MSDARRYAVWPDPWSRSWAIQSCKSGHFQQLSPPPFMMGAGNWRQILKLQHNILICLGRIFDIWSCFCVTWLWSWQKRQLWTVDRQSSTGLIYLFLCFHFNDFFSGKPVNSFKAVSETKNINYMRWLGLIFSSSTFIVHCSICIAFLLFRKCVN